MLKLQRKCKPTCPKRNVIFSSSRRSYASCNKPLIAKIARVRNNRTTLHVVGYAVSITGHQRDVMRANWKWAMNLADISANFQEHAVRDNTEMCIVHGAQYSGCFTADEGKRRARHSQSTQDKYYARPPHPMWQTTVLRIPEAKRRCMQAEEFITLF